MSNPVPNLPPTSGVQDLAVRSFLDALSQAWTVRNGQTRVTDERFLTVKDLTDGINLFKNGGSGGALTGDAAPSPSANAIAVTLADLSAEIMQSRLYRWLGERINRIQYMNRPDWLPPGNAAMVKEEITELVDDYHVLARKVTTAAAEFNGNLALARQELTALATANEATAQSVTKLQTNVKDNFALVNETLESHTTSISSQASAITTLQTDVGDSQLAAQQALKLAQDIEGNLEGTWGVKFDTGQYIAGFGMALDGTTTAPTSMFGVRADKFFIGPPAVTGTNGQSGTITVNQMDADTVDRYALPFVVTTSNWTAPSTGKTYGPGVWINTARIATAHIDSAHIANAAITNAKIKDAEIGTLKIAGNAVTVPVTGSRYDQIYGAVGLAIEVWVTIPYAATVLAFYNCSQGFPYGDKSWNAALVIDNLGVVSAGGMKTLDTVAMSGSRYLPAGTYQVRVDVSNSSQMSINGRTLSVFAAMR